MVGARTKLDSGQCRGSDGQGSEFPALMHLLAALIGEELQKLMSLNQVNDRDLWTPGSATGLQQWQEHITQELEKDPDLSETDRLALVLARRGRGASRSASSGWSASAESPRWIESNTSSPATAGRDATAPTKSALMGRTASYSPRL